MASTPSLAEPEPLQPAMPVTPVAAPTPALTFDATFTTGSDESALSNVHEDLPVAPIDAHAGMPGTGRPVTSEMVALDAFDAFDTVWGSPETTATPAPPDQIAAPLDEVSLGTGVDAQQLWADEITSPPDNVWSVTPPASHHVDPDSVGSEWASAIPADPGMPAWLADDDSPPTEPTTSLPALDAHDDVTASAMHVEQPAPASPESTVAPASSEEGWPDQLLAEYAPYIPTPSSVAAIKAQAGVPRQPEIERPNSPVSEPPAQLSADLAQEPGFSVVPPQLDQQRELPTPSTQFEQQPEFSAPSMEFERQPEVAGLSAQLDHRPETVAAPPHGEPTVGFGSNPPSEPDPESLPGADIQFRTPVTHGARVSAALDRLAERVRSGEIDVSSVAPEAPDAAVLASVLAALLGGSSSR